MTKTSYKVLGIQILRMNYRPHNYTSHAIQTCSAFLLYFFVVLFCHKKFKVFVVHIHPKKLVFSGTEFNELERSVNYPTPGSKYKHRLKSSFPLNQ